ncbi:NfeD family protein [Sphingomonas sp. IC-56]|uniref:NfeD family protein n=1 Tax=Sphingomonas sp. IC-56 TaxID=2898529 RepID=UPI001E3EF131|nr:NfeD family protein [Sphingomonas sp. IC-56]MCD2325345.1 NfeD family protein [Sphingomonas sp. IC-56]
MDWIESPAVLWLIAGVLLATAELLIPGVYLVFFALAAAITGAIALLFPELSLGGQLAGFAAWSLAVVLIGKRWYRDFPVATSDPLLNDRVARLIGETVTVVQAIEDGQGRVRVGDGEWIAHGPDQPAGARVRITGASGGSLTVEPVLTLTA